MQHSPIDIIVVSGFLGSGKTTLLRRIRDRAGERSLVYLVNDFPPEDVDGRRLEVDDAQLTCIAGGSVFCRCKSADFLAALRRIAACDPAPDAVVIEASGIANPKAFGRRLTEFELADRFRLRRCICLAEPATLVKLRFTLPVVRDQLEAADTVLLNKADLSSAVDRQVASDYVRQVNPEAELHETVRADCPLDGLFAAGTARDFGEVPGRDDTPFATVTAAPPGAVDWPRLRADFDALDLHRVKGLVPTGTGAREVDWTHAGGWSEETGGGGEPLLVFVVARPDRERAEALATAIAEGGYAA